MAFEMDSIKCALKVLVALIVTLRVHRIALQWLIFWNAYLTIWSNTSAEVINSILPFKVLWLFLGNLSKIDWRSEEEATGGSDVEDLCSHSDSRKNIIPNGDWDLSVRVISWPWVSAFKRVGWHFYMMASERSKRQFISNIGMVGKKWIAPSLPSGLMLALGIKCGWRGAISMLLPGLKL